MSFIEWVIAAAFVLPLALVLIGGSLWVILEALAPNWYLYLKERRQARINAVKAAVRRER